LVQGEEDSHWKRLEAMPREQRVNLSENLDRFDRLAQPERDPIRALDAEIAKLDPLVQDRYHVLLRRYHTWISGLSPAQKTQLTQAGSPDAKIALVDKWRRAEKLANSPTKSLLVLGVHPGDLGMIPPFELANALKVWLQLDAKERSRIERLNPIRARMAELNRIGFQNNISRSRFPHPEEAAILKRIESNNEVKIVFADDYHRLEKEKTEGKASVQKLPTRPNSRLHGLTESLYFIDHPPTPVTMARLVQFEAELPPWFRASLDPLPPEDTRRRLTILYRQIYEPPAEIPPAKKTEPAKSVEKPKSAVARPTDRAVEF